jgi:lysophospholipase L1-like esterase
MRVVQRDPMENPFSQTPHERPARRSVASLRLLLVATAVCALTALVGCGSALKATDPGLETSAQAAVTQSTGRSSGNPAATATVGTKTGSAPAASETKAPAVSASYIPASAAYTAAAVYLQGDSLTVPVTGLLTRLVPKDTWAISAKIGRPLSVGLSLLTQRAKKPGLPQIVVMEMGSNDDPAMPSSFARMMAQTMAVIGSSRCAVWVNLYQRATKKVGKKTLTYNVYDQLNTVIAQADAHYKNLAVVPWATMAPLHPSWFGPDGVHPNDAGSAVFAQMIAAAVKNCKVSGTPLGTPPDPSGGAAPPS